MPPWRASAIAIRASVTVSIALETIGILRRDVAGQTGGSGYLAGDQIRLSRNQENVIEGQAKWNAVHLPNPTQVTEPTDSIGY